MIVCLHDDNIFNIHNITQRCYKGETSASHNNVKMGKIIWNVNMHKRKKWSTCKHTEREKPEKECYYYDVFRFFLVSLTQSLCCLKKNYGHIRNTHAECDSVTLLLCSQRKERVSTPTQRKNRDSEIVCVKRREREQREEKWGKSCELLGCALQHDNIANPFMYLSTSTCMCPYLKVNTMNFE